MASSASGITAASPNLALCGATKAFEKSLGLSMAKEMETCGAGVTCLMPGPVIETQVRDRSGTGQASCWHLLPAQSAPPAGSSATAACCNCCNCCLGCSSCLNPSQGRNGHKSSKNLNHQKRSQSLRSMRTEALCRVALETPLITSLVPVEVGRNLHQRRSKKAKSNLLNRSWKEWSRKRASTQLKETEQRSNKQARRQVGPSR
jgi:hypothetical protein